MRRQAVSIQHLETKLNTTAQGVTELRGETVNRTEQVNVRTNLVALIRKPFSICANICLRVSLCSVYIYIFLSIENKLLFFQYHV